MITYEKQAQIMKLCEQRVRDKAPNPKTRGITSTGNLAFNAVTLRDEGNGVWVLWINEDIAPYMKYTEEDWSLFKEPLHGKQNPNQAWFERVCGDVADIIAAELGGRITKD